MKAILIIDVIVVAIAAGTYIYLQNQGILTYGAKPAEFTVTDLTINPFEAEVGEPVFISVNVTNIGEENGNYSANLTINDALKGNQTIILIGGTSTIVEFTDIENSEGNYTAKIDGLSGWFVIKPAPPTTSAISLSDLLVSPYEAWVGDPISIKATASNPSGAVDSLSVELRINDTAIETQKVELAAGQKTTVEFNVTESSEGTYSANVGSLTGKFKIVPTGKHTLIIGMAAPIKFTVDGESETAPYRKLLDVGTYTIDMPATDPTGEYTFENWEDGSLNPRRTINLQSYTVIVAYYSGGTSCPSLYVWNGTSYVYVAEVSSHGWLGYTRYVNEDGSLEYWKNNPWDYIPLNKNQLQPNNGYYNLSLIMRWDEIFFIDSAYMLVVDHPSNQDVYSTMVEQYIDPNYMGKIYTVRKNPLKPVSAFNELATVLNGIVIDSYNKVDALPAISNMDGIFTTGFNGKYSQAWNNQTWNRLTLNLGNLTGAPQINLIVRAIVDWGQPESYSLWMDKFCTTRVPNHTEPTPTSFMEVEDAKRNWVSVPESRQFPLPPDGVARTFVVNLTGLFPTNDYSLRINNFWNVTFDYIGIDISPQANVSIQRIDPQAILYQAFASPSVSSGNFTRYGDVTQLVLNEDDKFVIGRQGDAVSLQFPTANLAPIPEGMERDYFFFVACWFKVEYANYGFGPGFGFTVDPLPFQNMSGFPYPLQTESYPFDAEHSSYLQKWNTRAISPLSSEPKAAFNKNIFLIVVFVGLILAAVLSYAVYKSSARNSHIHSAQRATHSTPNT